MSRRTEKSTSILGEHREGTNLHQRTKPGCLKNFLCWKNERTSGFPFENARKEKQWTWAPRRSLTENNRCEKHNNKVCVCLSRLATIYSLCLSKAVDTFLSLSRSFRWLLRKDSSKYLRIKRTNRRCFVFMTFYYGTVTTMSDWNLRSGTTSITNLESWCCKRLKFDHTDRIYTNQNLSLRMKCIHFSEDLVWINQMIRTWFCHSRWPRWK